MKLKDCIHERVIPLWFHFSQEPQLQSEFFYNGYFGILKHHFGVLNGHLGISWAFQ